MRPSRCTGLSLPIKLKSRGECGVGRTSSITLAPATYVGELNHGPAYHLVYTSKNEKQNYRLTLFSALSIGRYGATLIDWASGVSLALMARLRRRTIGRHLPYHRTEYIQMFPRMQDLFLQMANPSKLPQSSYFTEDVMHRNIHFMPFYFALSSFWLPTNHIRWIRKPVSWVFLTYANKLRLE